jgi:hypothetical protein
MTGEGVVARVRQPAYTGENRCLPCTVVNVGLAGIVSLQVLLWATVAGAPVPGAAAAATLFALSLVSVWLRGYLVPGTPVLAARLPERVLELFHGDPRPLVARGLTGRGTGAPDSTDAEPPVAGVLDDDALDESFRTEWDAALDRDRSDAATLSTRLAGRFDLDGAVTVSESSGEVVARAGGHRVGVWESRLAVEVDLAAAAVLSERVDGWATFAVARRGRWSVALRARRETCPDCGASLSTGVETVASCCRSREVRVADCVPCGVRVSETPVEESDTPDATTETERALGDAARVEN